MLPFKVAEKIKNKFITGKTTKCGQPDNKSFGKIQTDNGGKNHLTEIEHKSIWTRNIQQISKK